MASTGDKKMNSLVSKTSEYCTHIYYEDTDFSGYVYHANYLKFFERAREHFLGLDFLKDLFQSGYHFVVSQANIKYLAPAVHGDRVIVKTHIKFSDNSPSIEFFQQAIREEKDHNRKVLVDGQILVVGVNENGRPSRPPKNVKEKLFSLI